MREQVKRNFILQQGFEEPAPAVCPRQYSALHFQPRTVFVWIVAGIVFQSPPLFYALCTVLWWSALFPKINPFDALYNLTFRGNRVEAFYRTPSPVPRRTAQAMAGAFALTCGLLCSLRPFDCRVCGGRNLFGRRPRAHFGRLLSRFIRVSRGDRSRNLRLSNATLGTSMSG
jgi:hypothetical protein